MSQEKVTPSQTYWVRLYAVERAGSHHFVYGYAVSAKANLNQWRSSNVPVSGSTWKLKQFNCFADQVEIQRLQQAAENGTITIPLGGQPLSLISSCLAHRPRVIAIPHDALSDDRPKSFSDDMAEMESHWELDKRVLIERLFPNPPFDAGTAQRVATELLEQLEAETGIKFGNEDSGRLGNLDVFRHLSGDFRLPDGLCCRSLRKKSGDVEQLSLLVWLEPPIADLPNLVVGCRLFNGGSASGRTCIMSEVREYSRAEKIDFIPQEPFSQFEVSVWSEQGLVGYRTFSIVRGMSFNMHVRGAKNRVRTKWSESLPAELRDRAETVPSGISQSSKVGSGSADPWRETELAARQTVRTGFSGKTAAKYFGVTPEAQLEALEFVSGLILRPNVKRVTIADPFFDDIGVESLLVKVAQTQDVRILASHTSSSGGKARLLASCESLRDKLPRNVTIINIETPGEASQQFHDRYVLIEMDEDSNAESELWMLSNSFSSMAKNYPLIIAMLPPDVAEEVAAYMRDLEQGKPPGKNHATRTLVWSKASSSPSPRPVALPGKKFEGSDSILALLVSDQGLLSDWRVPDQALPTVVGAVKRSLVGDPSHRVEHLIAIARWHYHGGPSASKYHFEDSEMQWLADAFRQLLASDTRQNVQIAIEAIQNNTEMPECLNDLWYSVNQMPFELLRGTNPALYFFAEALWGRAPEILVEILDETKSTALFGWLCMEGSGGTKVQFQALLAARAGFIKAVGEILLWQYCEREASAQGGSAVAIFRAELMSSRLPPIEAWLSLVFVEAKTTIPAKANAALFEQSSATWFPTELSEETLARLTLMISRAAPNRGVVVIARLAEVSPHQSWRDALHRWCITQVLGQLRLKNPSVAQSGVSVWCNAETILAAARTVWNVHGDRAAIWFEQDVMNNLKLSDALEPLLRTRDYTRWSDALDSVMLALWFGRAVAQEAPSMKRSGEFAIHTAPRMSKILMALGPEIWRSYVHKDEQLSCIVAFIGWSADYCDETGLATIEQLVISDQVPSVWRLWLVVQSPKLILKHPGLVEAMAVSLSTGTSCHSDQVDEWCGRIRRALNHLEEQASEQLIRRQKPRSSRYHWQFVKRFDEDIRAARLRGLFHHLRCRLSQWQSSFQDTRKV